MMEEVLKTEETKPGYKKTKLGWIPSEWDFLPISAFGKVVTGNTPSTKIPEFYNGDFLFVSPADISRGKYIVKTEKTLSERGFESGRKIPAGSVLFVCIGSTIGKIAVAAIDVITNQQINAVIPNSHSDGDFIYYQLDLHKGRIKRIAGNQAVPILNKTTFSKIEVFHPPLPEQRKIAEVLSTWDRAIDALTKLIEKKKERKKGLMESLLSGSLRFTNFQKEWKGKKIGEVLKIKHGRNQEKVKSEDGVYPILGTGGIMGYANDYLHEGPSVLIGRKGTIDKPQYMTSPFWTVDTLFYSEVFDSVDPKWLYYLFCTINWKRYNEASGVPSLSASTISSIKIKFPPKEEQQKTSSVLSAADREIEKLAGQLEKLEEQKKGLMQKLLTGEIRVNER